LLLDNADEVEGTIYGCTKAQFGINLASILIMEAITNNENGPVQRSYSRDVATPSKGTTSPSAPATNANLTDIGKIADQASQAGAEIRPEAIQRAKSLLADPNWPNDTVIEKLAEKLLSTDDFTS